MKQLLFIITLISAFECSGQKYESFKGKFHLDSTYYTFNKNISFFSESKVQARINNNSDTLVIMDTVLTMYGLNIRYIKIKDKVYPLKNQQP